MPKPSDYTPARQRLLQIVMGGILLATIALAALVGSGNRRANRVELSAEAVTSGGVSVRLPARWRPPAGGGDADDPRAIARAEESAPSRGPARRVTVMVEALDAPASPVQYLVERFRLPINELSEDNEDAVALVAPATVAGRAGVAVSIVSLPLGVGAPRETQKDVYAVAVLPSRRAIVVHLRGVGLPDTRDRMLVEQIAAAITVSDDDSALGAAAGAVVTLPAGTTFAVPAGFVPVESRDPLRSERVLWPVVPRGASVAELESQWATVEAVECLFPPPTDAAAARAAFATLLLVRDPMWQDATILPDGPNAWQAAPAETVASGVGGTRFPTRAYLLADPASGRALLAVFRGGFSIGGDGGERAFNGALKQLAASVKFAAPAPIAALEARGAAVAERLRSDGYEKLITDRTEQWWLWTNASDRPHIGWSHVDFDAAGGTSGEVRAKTETRRRRDGNGGSGHGRVTRVSGDVRHADATGHYRAEVARGDADGAADAPRSIRQLATWRDGQLSIDRSTPSRPLGQWKSPAPPQFVPGELLPLLMDQVTRSGDLGDGSDGRREPVLLRSEAFPGYEALGAPMPLTIIVRPFANPTSRKAEGEDRPMRCVEAEVNGSGVVSRWYFRANGSVETIELPGGVRRTASNPSDIHFSFGTDKQMAPP